MEKFVKIEDTISLLANKFEKLSNGELFAIRGGNTDDRTKTKETDIYDTREG